MSNQVGGECKIGKLKQKLLKKAGEVCPTMPPLEVDKLVEEKIHTSSKFKIRAGKVFLTERS